MKAYVQYMAKSALKYTMAWDPSNCLMKDTVCKLLGVLTFTFVLISKSKPVQWKLPITQTSKWFDIQHNISIYLSLNYLNNMHNLAFKVEIHQWGSAIQLYWQKQFC